MELKSSENIAVKYHDIFDYKLTKEELLRWQYKKIKESTAGVKNKSRLKREKYSKKKLIIAKKAAKLISRVSTVKFVGITGALAMMNSGRDSDIDLMIITQTNRLWLTRFFVYYTLYAKRFTLRRPRVKDERDALCLNMWLDENDLIWDKADRNLYTAHEIAQIVPLVNKDKTYEIFLYLNKWILSFWPHSVKIENWKLQIKNSLAESSFFEKLSFRLQYIYMKPKITREIVTPTRAIFHPHDWGKVVMEKLND